MTSSKFSAFLDPLPPCHCPTHATYLYYCPVFGNPPPPSPAWHHLWIVSKLPKTWQIKTYPNCHYSFFCVWSWKYWSYALDMNYVSLVLYPYLSDVFSAQGKFELRTNTASLVSSLHKVSYMCSCSHTWMAVYHGRAGFKAHLDSNISLLHFLGTLLYSTSVPHLEQKAHPLLSS